MTDQINFSYEKNQDRSSNASRCSKPILGKMLRESTWTKYANASAAAKSLTLNKGNINQCCSGRRQQDKENEFMFDAPNEPDILDGEEWRNIVI